MRIGVNTIHLTPESGDEDVFLRNVLRALRATQPDVELVLFTDPLNDESFDGFERVCLTEATGDLRTSAVASALRRAVGAAKVDRLFTRLVSSPQKCPAPVVSLVVDLPFVNDAGRPRMRWGDLRLKDLKRAAAKSAVTVVPTEYARKRLLEALRVPLERSVVARPGADHLPAGSQPPRAEKPYLLSVGPTHPRRNIDGLMKAFERIQDEIPHHLILVGEPGESERADWGPRVLRFHRCPAGHLAGLYQHCDLAIFPAQDDASAMGVLEAMFTGARVVSGKVGGVPEVARNVPFYCDPERPSSLAVTILHALEEEQQQRSHRIKSGQQIAAEHTWAACAGRVFRALQR